MRIELTRDGIAAAQLDLKSRRPTRTDPLPCKEDGAMCLITLSYDILTQPLLPMLVF